MNRTERAVSVAALLDDRPPQVVRIEPGDARPLFANASARVRLPGGSSGDVPLDPDAAYEISAGSTNETVALQKIPLGSAGSRPWNPPERPPLEFAGANLVPVKILVDDDERRPRSAWEPIIRQRVEDASDVFEAHCGLRLKIVAFDAWDSDDGQTDFFKSLAEFEREVLPAPGVVAIGFSSQYLAVKGRVHMGGTRGPLHSHILIKERARNLLETERVELLVHELGHYFGATHSPEPTSIMRPVLGQGRMRAAGAHIQFDAANTLLMSMMAEEIRQRRVRKLDDLTGESRRRMREIYAGMEAALADDPSAGHYLRLIAAANARPVVEDARKIALRMVQAAKVERKLAAAADGPSDVDSGDLIVQVCVREGARAAKQLRGADGAQSLLLALGSVLGDSGSLQRHPIAAKILPHIESQQERKDRLAALEAPTMRGRADLAKHFFMSASLVGLIGQEATHGIGLVKELSDADGGTGFSFADVAANRAGIVFAGAILSRRLSLDAVAERFTVESAMPAVDDLREELGLGDFKEGANAVDDGWVAAELAKVDARIRELPLYQGSPAVGSIVAPQPSR